MIPSTPLHNVTSNGGYKPRIPSRHSHPSSPSSSPSSYDIDSLPSSRTSTLNDPMDSPLTSKFTPSGPRDNGATRINSSGSSADTVIDIATANNAPRIPDKSECGKLVGYTLGLIGSKEDGTERSRYTFLESIGVGTYSEVYKAHDSLACPSSSLVAIKCIPVTKLRFSQDTIEQIKAAEDRQAARPGLGCRCPIMYQCEQCIEANLAPLAPHKPASYVSEELYQQQCKESYKNAQMFVNAVHRQLNAATSRHGGASNKAELMIEASSVDPHLLLPKFYTAPDNDSLNSEVRFHLSLPPHDNVIELYRVEYKKDVLFLIMELVEGTSLAELMVTHPAFTSKSWDSHNTHIKDIYGSVVKAIDHCHRHGLYHRDIKPENVVINVHETEWSMWFFVKVIDFGLATDQLQSKDVFCGTLRYMSPEAINYRDEQQVDKNDVSNVTAALPAATTTINSAAADVWSLGVLLFRLLNPINQMDVTMFWKVASMNDIVFEKYASDAKDFIAKLPFTDIVRKILGQALVIDPKRRISMSRLAELVSNVTMYVSTHHQGPPPPPPPSSSQEYDDYYFPVMYQPLPIPVQRLHQYQHHHQHHQHHQHQQQFMMPPAPPAPPGPPAPPLLERQIAEDPRIRHSTAPSPTSGSERGSPVSPATSATPTFGQRRSSAFKQIRRASTDRTFRQN